MIVATATRHPNAIIIIKVSPSSLYTSSKVSVLNLVARLYSLYFTIIDSSDEHASTTTDYTIKEETDDSELCRIFLGGLTGIKSDLVPGSSLSSVTEYSRDFFLFSMISTPPPIAAKIKQNNQIIEPPASAVSSSLIGQSSTADLSHGNWSWST